MGKRKTRDEWSAIVAAYERGTQSAAEFCASHRIERRTLAWWRWQLRQPRARRAEHEQKGTVRLLAVKVVEDEAARTRRAVVIAVGGVEVQVDTAVDVDYVASLVARLRQS